jgi:hypothetical protein
MTAQLIPFPNFFRPATPRDEPCSIVILPVIHIEQECPKVQELRRHCKLWLERNPVAKEPEANVTEARCGFGAMGSSRRGMSRFMPTTSENLDVTARRDGTFQFSGGTCSGGEM